MSKKKYLDATRYFLLLIIILTNYNNYLTILTIFIYIINLMTFHRKNAGTLSSVS